MDSIISNNHAISQLDGEYVSHLSALYSLWGLLLWLFFDLRNQYENLEMQ